MADRESTTDPTLWRAKRKRPWLRRVGVVVGCLLAGAIINVLVAWGFVWHFYGNYAKLVDDYASFTDDKRGALDVLRKRAPDELDHRVDIQSSRHSAGFARVEIHAYHPEEIWTYNIQRTLAGWPVYSLTCNDCLETRGSDRHIRELYGGIRIRDSIDSWVIPLRPDLRGFALNTSFYATVTWFATIIPFGLRRRRRIRRGLCPSCAYDLRGADHGKCPECGVVVKRRRE